MKRVILSDTCLELNEELKERVKVKMIPLSLDLGDQTFIDGEDLDIRDFVDKMHAYEGVPKTAAPSPQAFYDAMKGYDEAFIITLSSALSTVYNSAIIAKDMIETDFPNMKVHVFDSKSAVTGETILAMRVQDLINAEKPFEEIVTTVEKYRDEMRTFFILENLDNLVKNGRMSKFAGKMASILSINPVCKGTKDGTIEVVAKSRGIPAGIKRMVEQITEGLDDLGERILVINHVLNVDRALEVKKKFDELYKFKEVHIVPSKGVTSIYANEGGIVVSL